MFNLFEYLQKSDCPCEFLTHKYSPKNKFDEYCCRPNINSEITSDNNKGN
jgi:hypothetical protein